jgi:hypothetical protein
MSLDIYGCTEDHRIDAFWTLAIIQLLNMCRLNIMAGTKGTMVSKALLTLSSWSRQSCGQCNKYLSPDGV